MPKIFKPTPAMNEMLKRAGNKEYAISLAGQRELAKALTLPLRRGVVKGDIVSDIYEETFFEPGIAVEYPLDFLTPGTEGEHVAYVIPSQGRIPERHVQGDFVMVPTYEIGSSIDFTRKYLRDARWDIVKRAMSVVEGGFIRKHNTDGWRVLLAAGYGRNLVVYDDAATAGLFTKRVVALGKTIMRRYAGGNSSSLNRGKLTRLYVSPESLEDVRTWDLTQVDDFTRREIFISEDQGLTKIFGVELRDLDELGVGQEFQTYLQTTLGQSLPGSKLEFAVGLDTMNKDSFVHPVREEIEIFEDPTFHRQNRVSMYGRGESGWSVLDARRVLLFAI